jgi:hypothetical protein
LFILRELPLNATKLPRIFPSLSHLGLEYTHKKINTESTSSFVGYFKISNTHTIKTRNVACTIYHNYDNKIINMNFSQTSLTGSKTEHASLIGAGYINSMSKQRLHNPLLKEN